MYAKLKPIVIPNAMVSMNVLLTGGLNRTETIESTFQAQWLLYLLPDSTLKNSAVIPHNIFYVFYTHPNKYY